MLMDLMAELYSTQHSAFYAFVTYYIGLYPLVLSVLWATTSLLYYFRKERDPLPINPNSTYLPRVSVLISAHNEENHIANTIECLCEMNYPNYEIVIVNDGSTDGTLAILEKYALSHGIRVIHKETNQGKAIALNDALMCLTGEIIFCTDADAEIEPNAIQYMIPNFKNGRLAAVAGNPRIRSAENFLCRMQILEYASVIGMIRRSQRVWGRIMTFSGVIFAVRKNDVFRVGLFDPNAATEDIDLTWKLQRQFFDIFYEPRAIAWIDTPKTYKTFFRQRLRWARGLMYVVHVNFDMMFQWKYRRMWPVIIENILSNVWVFCAVTMLILWFLSYVTDYPMGISFVPLTWGICIATANLFGQVVAVILDKDYEPDLKRFLPYAPYFAIYYWILLAVVAFIEMPRLIFKPKPTLGWVSKRE